MLAETSWNALSDFLGFSSGSLLLVTALRNDKLFSFIGSLKRDLKEAEDAGVAPDKKAAKVVEALEKEPSRWTGFDRWALRLGVMLLFLSYACKVGPTVFPNLKAPACAVLVPASAPACQAG